MFSTTLLSQPSWFRCQNHHMHAACDSMHASLRSMYVPPLVTTVLSNDATGMWSASLPLNCPLDDLVLSSVVSNASKDGAQCLVLFSVQHALMRSHNHACWAESCHGLPCSMQRQCLHVTKASPCLSCIEMLCASAGQRRPSPSLSQMSFAFP